MSTFFKWVVQPPTSTVFVLHDRCFVNKHCARNEMGKEYHHLIGVGTPSVTCFVDPSYLDHPNKEGNEEAYPLHSMIGNCWNLECTRCLQICNSFLFRIGLFGTFYVS